MTSHQFTATDTCFVCNIELANRILPCNHLICLTCLAMYRVKEVMNVDIKCRCGQGIDFSKIEERKHTDYIKMNCSACDSLLLTVCDTCQKPYCDECFTTKHYYHEDHKLVQNGPTICKDHNLPKVFYCDDCLFPAWFCLLCKEVHQHKVAYKKYIPREYSADDLSTELLTLNDYEFEIKMRKEADMKDFHKCTALLQDAKQIISNPNATSNEIAEMHEKLDQVITYD